eukprot:1081332-Amphidinium_carterae.1
MQLQADVRTAVEQVAVQVLCSESFPDVRRVISQILCPNSLWKALLPLYCDQFVSAKQNRTPQKQSSERHLPGLQNKTTSVDNGTSPGFEAKQGVLSLDLLNKQFARKALDKRTLEQISGNPQKQCHPAPALGCIQTHQIIHYSPTGNDYNA